MRVVSAFVNTSFIPRNRGLAASAAALGVVFGDIGTSPLYVMKAVFTSSHISLVPADILGVTSCIIWALLALVTGKYVLLVLRADHEGEGGILALSSLVISSMKSGTRLWKILGTLGIFGAALFFGDSVITPAISVLSAVEGLTVGSPGLSVLVLPLALVLLTGLFSIQRFGTSKVGRAFAPIMALWFLTFIALGLPQIVHTPEVLWALSPTYALRFVSAHPFAAFIALGAIVLALTGAEALFADIAHFGRRPIQTAWFALVLPALMVIYLGQAALLIRNPEAIENPFFLMAPSWAAYPLVIGATLATLIASQAVISGAYSVAIQCSRLRLFPHVRVHYTSEHERGQVYLPGVNALLFIAVAIVVIIFRNSERLSGAYGLAVSTDFLITTALLLFVTAKIWHWHRALTALLGLALIGVEIFFWASNVTKIATGGWLPLAVALVLFAVMLIWRSGEKVTERKRLAMETPITTFFAALAKNPPRRVPGTAVYFHSLQSTTPLMLERNLRTSHTLHDRVLIVSAKTLSVPHVDPSDRAELLNFVDDLPGVYHVIMRYGFMDSRNLLPDLEASKIGSMRTWNFSKALVFTSHIVLELDETVKRSPWLKAIRKIFVLLSRTSASPGWLRLIPADQQAEGAFHIAI